MKITNNHLTQPMFFGEPVSIARYDKVRYKNFDTLTKKQLGYFWQPEEVDLTRDAKDFKMLLPHEQHIFTSNLKRQIVLDSVQGRCPSTVLLPITSLPEVEVWIQTWAFFETIHSRSYTHIIQNVYADPSKVFDEISSIQEIVDCANDISKYYDELSVYNSTTVAHNLDFDPNPQDAFERKKALWLCLNSVNALEGIRFYVSFACAWAFAESKRMEGNARIIKLICRDENLHLASTQQMLKLLPKEDKDFALIKESTKDQCVKIYNDVIEQEKVWAEYLFKDGSIIGLNAKLLCDYVDWIASKRMATIDLPYEKFGGNPLPWTQKWIAGEDVQVAPQEVENTQYVVGQIKQDITKEFLDGFKL